MSTGLRIVFIHKKVKMLVQLQLCKHGKTDGKGWKFRVLVDKSVFNLYYE